MANNFFDTNSHHGLAKRIVLYRFLQAQVARALNTPGKIGDFDITYVDTFSGSGLYGNIEEEGQMDDLDIINEVECPFDEHLGSPLVALEALFKHVTEQKVTGLKRALFVFIERDQDRYDQLEENVRDYITRKGPVNNVQSGNSTVHCRFELNVLRQNSEINIIEVQIRFRYCDFKNFNNDDIRNNEPMITFFDPFGFTDTPMERVMSYSGRRKSIILNLMVRDINRFAGLDRNQANLDLLFGSGQWRMYLPENFSELSVVRKMESYAIAYRNCFQDEYLQTRDDSIRFLRFSLRKGSRQSVEKRFIYYMMFAAVDLTAMKSVKYALHTAAQNFKLPERPETTSDELFFTDFHFNPERPWCPKKAEDLKEEEANYIYQHYRGQVVLFGDLKEWVLMETPYQFHSRALQHLENLHDLRVISTEYDRLPGVPQYERNRPAFPGGVGTYRNDPDWDHRQKILYCNGWRLQFCDSNED